MNSQNITVPTDRENVACCYHKYPVLDKLGVLKQTFEIINPGKKNAIFIFPGGQFRDYIQFKKGKLFSQLYGSHKFTLIFFNWEKYFYIPELVAAQIEDLYTMEKFTSLFVYGASIGGMCALELLMDIYRKKLPIKINGLITVLSPYEISDIRLALRIKFLCTRIWNLFTGSHLSLISLKGDKSYSEFREFYAKLPVLALTSYGYDPLVNNILAVSKMKSIFPKLVNIMYKGKSLIGFDRKNYLGIYNMHGAHFLEDFERARLRKDVFSFLSKHCN